MAEPASEKKIAKAEKKYERAFKTSKPGEGKRFGALEGVFAAKGAEDPGALAAWIGRKKFGKKRFAKLAQ